MRTVLPIVMTGFLVVVTSAGTSPAASAVTPAAVRACAVTHAPGVMECMALRQAVPE